METERVARALARIEAAVTRIETAASRPRQLSDPNLARKHAELRATVGETLRDLDSLIGQFE
jgi:hypothetical protein